MASDTETRFVLASFCSHLAKLDRRMLDEREKALIAEFFSWYQTTPPYVAGVDDLTDAQTDGFIRMGYRQIHVNYLREQAAIAVLPTIMNHLPGDIANGTLATVLARSEALAAKMAVSAADALVKALEQK